MTDWLYYVDEEEFAGWRKWPALLKYIVRDWKNGNGSVLYTRHYFQLWSPLHSEIEEFPY